MNKPAQSLFYCLLALLLPAAAFSQNQPVPVARFHFNNGSQTDDVNNRQAHLYGASFANDRFGNRNSAVFLYGNAASYINLGNYAAIKPKHGSISLWVKIEAEIWAGKGREMNSFIITKNSRLDDFYEAYNISYFLDTKKVTAICSKDSTQQLAIHSIEKFELFKWHHFVVTFDDNSFAFYIDGRIEKKLPKDFVTQYNPNDSVLVGITGNKKNHRFSHGLFDDIEFYDRVLTDHEVFNLYTAENPNKMAVIFQWIMLLAACLVGLLGIFFFIRYRVRVRIKNEKLKLEQANKALENELRVQRALMNPHFIFNSLNGLQDFILKNANEEANDYLIKFSKLLRQIIENNASDTITLQMEIELLKSYIEIEGMRFEENFFYSVDVDAALVPSTTRIPIMMLQPFVENAIWHGLLNKEGTKSIHIALTAQGAEYIKCVIEDNGLGLNQKSASSQEKKSMAILFMRQRLQLLNKIHNLTCSLKLLDGSNGYGTRVEILLPILNKT